MQLYEINHNGNRYCGPSALSAIAGIGTKEAAAILRAHNGRTAIKGTYHSDMLAALAKLGFSGPRVIGYVKAARVNLRQWAKAHARGTDVHLVDAGNHWVLVQGRYAMCGKTKNLVAVEDHPSARAFVKSSCAIKQVRAVDPATVIPTKVTTNGSARRKARALAAQYGILLEPITSEPDSSVGVFQARGHHDPYDDGHYFSPDDWQGILDRVQEYVACQNSAPEPVAALTIKDEALALAALHGVTVEQDDHGNRTIWVYPPEPDGDDDPHADSHHVDTWGEAMARVQQYAAILAKAA